MVFARTLDLRHVVGLPLLGSVLALLQTEGVDDVEGLFRRLVGSGVFGGFGGGVGADDVLVT